MKKTILFSGILFFQLSSVMGMSPLQQAVRAYLADHSKTNAHYGFAPATEWLLKDVVECSDSNHNACTNMRRYFENYVPIMCQRDPYYSSQKNICNFIYEILVDQQFVQGLMRDHYFTEIEAMHCAKKLAEVLDNAQFVK